MTRPASLPATTQVVDAKEREYASVSFTPQDVVRRAAEDGITISVMDAEILLVRNELAIMEDATNAGLDAISGLLERSVSVKGRYADAYA